MSPRRSIRSGLLGLVGLFGLVACGPQPGLGLGLEIHLQSLTGDEIIQLVVLQGTDTRGGEVRCVQVEATCVADQPALRVVRLKIDGDEVSAYRLPLDTADATGANGQSFELPGIPPGSGYLLAVELARDDGAGEQRVGRGCVSLPEIGAGINEALADPVQVLETADGCNPAL